MIKYFKYGEWSGWNQSVTNYLNTNKVITEVTLYYVIRLEPNLTHVVHMTEEREPLAFFL